MGMFTSALGDKLSTFLRRRRFILHLRTKPDYLSEFTGISGSVEFGMPV